MLESTSKYGFSSFVVGTIIKPSIIDRDDYIRSKFRLRGIDSVKTDITHELSKQFSRKTKNGVTRVKKGRMRILKFSALDRLRGSSE